MPELYFKGKEFVHNHHLSVPYRPLIVDSDKSLGDGGLDDNLIIHGDNLHALKALLPRYAGKVDCVFIDPPYNTGNEGWCYNDNVNNPVMKEWLSDNPVNKDDMLKHDKWCAMMWPRLRLLHELLSDHGSIWITLDDNEVHHARTILDQIFGENSFVGQIAWQKRTSRENRAVLSPSFDHILLYSKALKDTWKLRRNLLTPTGDGYSNPDDDPRGEWASIPFSAQGYRENQVYTIVTPTGVTHKPPKGRCWGATEEEFEKYKRQNRVYWPKDGNGKPRIKQYPNEAKGLVPMTLWSASEVGTTEESKKHLLEIFSEYDESDLAIHAPKTVALVERIAEIATREDSIVLDSFAGSGTTAQAVLTRNIKDNGNRKFILVECEEYADTLTAERVRRIINGYDFQGTKKEELWTKKITFTSLKKANSLLDKIQAIKNIHENKFDTIKPHIKDDQLVVTGEKQIQKRVDGLEGSFTYCTLGDPIVMDDILTGKKLPDYQNLGAWLFHTATGEPLDGSSIDESKWYLGESSQFHVWLVYRPDLGFLKSREAALTLDLAETISATSKDKKHLVFAPARFVPNKTLLPMGVEHLPLPYALYRVNNA